MVTVIEVTTLISAPPEVVFDLELDADVHAASLAASGETATTSTGQAALRLGDEVTFSARHLGRRWQMTAVITEHERPGRFVDQQVRGPFRSLRHEHLFIADGTGGTRMVDRMSVRAPGGPVGALVCASVLRPHLRRLLVHRAAHVKALAEGAPRSR
ncbi:Ligand-binding SRPBCC domain-containing protein [Quadrisphaera granulorum]|uniref:Ligand-binding SRPBCC domain-containing protein n=1 Tax=Quadrisphaera granulorum TaxID=317664 RepID=A0A315ZPT8_9ACTN|nr:SRPBCC family protein [Quadrisphaera granulorum]PWJ47113.1 ligand-binding SRPBCC domain-containing protein [Quadrisphaera granulorum]SZE98917.1 Ligand-binding SRPBCC domain-containing protein [Quadrisphaera granulorum]